MKNPESPSATRTAKLGRNPFEKKPTARVLKAEHTKAPANTHSNTRERASRHAPTPWRFAQGAFYWVMGATLECVATRLKERTMSRQ